MNKQLIQQLDFSLSMIEELQVTAKQRLSIAKHIANMPKGARIEFINALILIHHKSENYDRFAIHDEFDGDGFSDYDINEDREIIISSIADWNK